MSVWQYYKPLIISAGFGLTIGVTTSICFQSPLANGFQLTIATSSLMGLFGLYLIVHRIKPSYKLKKQFSLGVIVTMVIGIVIISGKLNSSEWAAPVIISLMFLGGFGPVLTNFKSQY